MSEREEDGVLPPAAAAAAADNDNDVDVDVDVDDPFKDAAGDLVHHFFPDGFPDERVTRRIPLDQLDALQDCWPERTERVPVKPEKAKESMRNLREQLSRRRGLSPGEILCVSIVACSSLPRAAPWGIGRGSKLVDGTSSCFVDLIRCLIPCSPRPTCNDENTDAIPSAAIAMLLSAVGTAGRCDGRGKAAVLRFLTLAVRSGCLRRRADVQVRRTTSTRESETSSLSSSDADGGGRGLVWTKNARDIVTALYASIFAIMTSDPYAVGDAVRLLHAVTRRRHACVFRAKAIRAHYDRGLMMKKQDGAAAAGAFAPLLLLLQLYARYDPKGCGQYFPKKARLSGAFSRYFRIPDEAWEREFSSFLRLRTNKNAQQEPGDTRNLLEKVSVVGEDAMSGSSPMSIRKKQRQGRGLASSLPETMDRLEDAFEGVFSSSWNLLDGNTGNKRRSVGASDLLSDESLRHVLILSMGPGSAPAPRANNEDVSSTELVRLRTCLPHMLYEEWSDAGHHSDDEDEEEDIVLLLSSDDEDDEQHKIPISSATKDIATKGRTVRQGRLRVIKALASMARHANVLPPEAEAFVVDEILPFWDGSDEIGQYLCNDVIPVLSPRSFRDLENRVLNQLGNLYTYGSARMKHSILSGALSGLIRHWSKIVWTAAVSKRKKGENTRRSRPTSESAWEKKHRTLLDLFQWTEVLVLKSVLSDQDNDLSHLSTLNFLEAACDVSEQCSIVTFPSPALIYHLLLSRTALIVDRVCALLLRYKVVIERLKTYSNAVDEESDRETYLDVERIRLFNCFVWDFCSVLWRCSPLPSVPGLGIQESEEGDVARTHSFLFTDIHESTLLELDRFSSELQVPSALSVTHGSVFANYASEFLMCHPVAQAKASNDLGSDFFTRYADSKVHYLDFLREKGFQNLYKFLTTFVGSLQNREKVA